MVTWRTTQLPYGQLSSPEILVAISTQTFCASFFFCVAVIEDLTEVEMGIDVATWRARIGLTYCYRLDTPTARSRSSGGRQDGVRGRS